MQAVIEIRMLWHAAYTLKGLNKYKYIIHYSDAYRCRALKEFTYIKGVTLSSIIDR